MAERYAALRRLGWQPSRAFLRAYREMWDRAGQVWLSTADRGTPPGSLS